MKKLFLLHYCSGRRLAVGFAVLITMVMTVASGWASSVLNAGWSYDQDDAVMTPSESSPYMFTLANPAFFSITDSFVPGDVYDVFDSGTLVLVTSFNGAQSPLSLVGDPSGEAGWISAQFSHGQMLLAAGTHSITVEDTTDAFGIPAGFYTRLDSAADSLPNSRVANALVPNSLVPEPAALVLLGIGLTGLGVYGLRRKS